MTIDTSSHMENDIKSNTRQIITDQSLEKCKNYYAFFDFDGTITKKDSFFEFIKFTIPTKVLMKGLVYEIPNFMKYLVGIYDSTMMKERIISRFYKGWRYARLETLAENFAKQKLPKIVKKEALYRIKWHIREGHTVAIVTGSLEFYVKAWVRSLVEIDDSFRFLDVIGTQIEVKNGIVTGRINGANCVGRQKVVSIMQKYKINLDDVIYAYGDSAGDIDMMKIANFRLFRNYRL